MAGWNMVDTTAPASAHPDSDDEATMVSFAVPAWVVSGRHMSPEAFASWVRVAAAMFRHGQGDISLGAASALAGMSQAEFMGALKEARQDTFAVNLDDLDDELSYLAERRQRDGAGG